MRFSFLVYQITRKKKGKPMSKEIMNIMMERGVEKRKKRMEVVEVECQI